MLPHPLVHRAGGNRGHGVFREALNVGEKELLVRLNPELPLARVIFSGPGHHGDDLVIGGGSKLDPRTDRQLAAGRIKRGKPVRPDQEVAPGHLQRRIASPVAIGRKGESRGRTMGKVGDREAVAVARAVGVIVLKGVEGRPGDGLARAGDSESPRHKVEGVVVGDPALNEDRIGSRQGIHVRLGIGGRLSLQDPERFPQDKSFKFQGEVRISLPLGSRFVVGPHRQGCLVDR